MKYEQTSLCEYGVSFWTDGWHVPCERESYLTRKEWKVVDKKVEESLTVSPEAWNRRFRASSTPKYPYQEQKVGSLFVDIDFPNL